MVTIIPSNTGCTMESVTRERLRSYGQAYNIISMKITHNKRADAFDIEENTIACDISHRGGTLKVNVSSLFNTGDEEAIMGAYQNYLGGGIAGAIVGASMFDKEALNKKDRATFDALNERIKRYFYEMNAGGGDDYMIEEVNSYARNQAMSASAY